MASLSKTLEPAHHVCSDRFEPALSCPAKRVVLKCQVPEPTEKVRVNADWSQKMEPLELVLKERNAVLQKRKPPELTELSRA
ncbi:UNVERIFIED_CONTAM: hypothetical protein K2H54_045282 [Gekko kuhli]